MSEIQSLLVHKLILDEVFRNQTYGSIQELIQEYNEEFYQDLPVPTASDHLVFYGGYVQRVAKHIGIDRRVWGDAFSWNPWRFLLNLRFELLSPNNAFKFHMKGEYGVDGAEELARRIVSDTDNFVFMMQDQLSGTWDIIMGHQCLATMFYKHGIALMICAVLAASAFTAPAGTERGRKPTIGYDRGRTGTGEGFPRLRCVVHPAGLPSGTTLTHAGVLHLHVPIVAAGTEVLLPTDVHDLHRVVRTLVLVPCGVRWLCCLWLPVSAIPLAAAFYPPHLWRLQVEAQVPGVLGRIQGGLQREAGKGSVDGRDCRVLPV